LARPGAQAAARTAQRRGAPSCGGDVTGVADAAGPDGGRGWLGWLGCLKARMPSCAAGEG